MTSEKIKQIQQDIERYRQAIEDAEDALEAAERELDEELEARYANAQEGSI